MEIKDLIGHKIVDISDNVGLLIKTDKGVYELDASTFPDGTLSAMYIEECDEGTWERWNE